MPGHPKPSISTAEAGASATIDDFTPDDSSPPTGSITPSQDLNGNGTNDYNLTLDGGNDYKTWGGYLIDIWSVDGNYITIIGDDDDGDGTLDDNGNGRLDDGEFRVIGECVYLPGCNYWYIEDGRIHQENWKDTDGDQVYDPNEELTHYIYDPATNILKVYHDPDGRGGPQDADLVYQGSPGGYDWHVF